MGLVETSFRNLVSQGIQHLPLPGLLHFNTDRLERQALRKQVEELQSSNTQLKQQLTCSQANPPATAHEEAQSGTQAQLQQAHRQPPSTQHSRSAQAQPSVHSKLVQARTKASKPSGAAPSPPKPISTSSRAQVLPAAATTHFPQSEGVDRPHADGAASSTQHPAAASETQAASHQADEAASLISEPQCSIGTAAARVDVNGSQGSQQTAMQGVSISGSLSDTRASNGTPSLLATTAANTGWQGSRHPLRQTSADQLSSSPRRANDMPAESSHATDQARPRSDLIANGSAGNAESSLQVAVEEQLEGHDHGITCCSFSPNGQNLATASSDGVVRIWAPESLEVLTDPLSPCTHCTGFLALKCNDSCCKGQLVAGAES